MGGGVGEGSVGPNGAASFETRAFSLNDKTDVQGVASRGTTRDGIPFGVAGAKTTFKSGKGFSVSESRQGGFSLFGDAVVVREGCATAPADRYTGETVGAMMKAAQEAAGCSQGGGGEVKVDWKVNDLGQREVAVSYTHTTVYSPGDMAGAAVGAAASAAAATGRYVHEHRHQIRMGAAIAGMAVAAGAATVASGGTLAPIFVGAAGGAISAGAVAAAPAVVAVGTGVAVASIMANTLDPPKPPASSRYGYSY